jgi:4-amino-4-deoxy-L-arabinose transferase-like glycosyltransferase
MSGILATAGGTSFMSAKSSCILTVGVAAVINLTVFACVGTSFPAYLQDFRRNQNPDAIHYAVLGHNILEHGAFSRQQSEPFVPDPLRTPIFPLVTGVVSALAGGVWGIYALNICCHIGTALLGCWFCRRHFGSLAGLSCGLLLAADLMLSVLNFEVMTEPLFCFLATASVLLAITSLSNSNPQNISRLTGFGSGTLLGLAILTRPAGLYLPFVLMLAAIFFCALDRTAFAVKYAAKYCLAVAILITPWIIRNYLIFGLLALSNIGGINYLYFAGGSAYALAHGIPLEQAQERISVEFGTVPQEKCHNSWTADRSVLDMAREQDAAVKILWRRYPAELLESSAIGAAKASIGHNVSTLAYLSGSSWHPPGVGRLFDGYFADFFEQLTINKVWLVAAWFWEEFLAVGVLIAAAIGCFVGLRRAELRVVTILIMAISLYYFATIAVVGMDSYARHRAPLSPLFAILATIGLGAYRPLRGNAT